MKCNECNNEMIFKATDIDSCWGNYKVTVRGLDAYICPKCGNLLLPAKTTKILEDISRGYADSEKQTKPDLLNITETAELLRVSNQSIYNMIKDGRLKASKCGREWRFSKKEIESLLNPTIQFPKFSNNQFAFAARKGEKITAKDAETINKFLSEIDDDSEK